jgi:hypothetical protein
MKYRGALTVGPSIEVAAFRFLELENARRIKSWPSNVMGGRCRSWLTRSRRKSMTILSSPLALWLSFQSEYAITYHRHNRRFTAPEAERWR